MKRTSGNGGYIAVGSVGDNGYTQANISGGNTDALFTRIGNNGTCYNPKRIDFNAGDDVFTCVIPSSSDTNKFYICGYSVHGMFTNCVIVAINNTGTIIWNKSLNFYTMPGTFQSSKAFGLCEVPTSSTTEDIVVCGSIASSPTDTNGLVFRLTGSSGTMVWAKQQGLASPSDSYQKIIYSSNGQLAVCGFTNYTAMSDVWITTMTTAGSVLQSKLVLFYDPLNPGSHVPSQAYDLREKNTELYITGNTNPKLPNMGLMFLKTTAMGDPILAVPSYNTQQIGDAYGIDLDANGVSNAGIRLYSNLLGAPSTVHSSSIALRTNMTGATCITKDSIIPNVDDMTPIISNINLSVNEDIIKSVNKLTAVNHDCNTQTICTGAVQPLLRNTDGLMANSYSEMEINEIITFPNPVSGTLNIMPANDIEKASIKVLNILGKVIMEERVVSLFKYQPLAIDLSSLSPGNYFIIVSTGDNRLTKKIIKQ